MDFPKPVTQERRKDSPFSGEGTVLKEKERFPFPWKALQRICLKSLSLKQKNEHN